jgi:multicomponent K+:H+ antiporter subunit A
VLVAGVVALAAWPLLRGSDAWLPATTAGTPASPVLVALWLIGAVGAVGTVVARRDRLVALAFAGVAGLVVGLAFVWFSAPDLAMTQLLVEVVTIVLMMLALGFLPRHAPPERAPGDAARRPVHAAIAVAAGVGIAVIAWAVLARPFPQSISPYFLATTVPEGGGSNTVNVILVDYRGFDTMGEIAVLGIAGLVIAGLLARVRLHRHGGDRPAAGAADAHPLLLGVVVRLLLPLAAVVAVHLFLRGHNLPGGGFVAGLVLSIALLLQYVALGVRPVESARSLSPQRWIGWGLAVAVGTGLAAWGFGYPFLTSAHVHPRLPVIGELPLASASAFDLGVTLTVVGATVLALASIGRLRRTP